MIRDRFQYRLPWKISRPWLPRVGRGADEWGNPSVWAVLPLLGLVTVFYGRLDRSKWFCWGSTGDILHYCSPDYALWAEVPAERVTGTTHPGDWTRPLPLTSEQIDRWATVIESSTDPSSTDPSC